LAGFTPASILILMAGTALLLGSLSLDATYLLGLAGFPADRLHHYRVQGDLALIRVIGGLIAIILVSSQVVFWVRPDAGRTFYAKVEALVRSAGPSFVPLSLGILVLAKTALQLTLFLFGYALYEGDDFGRAIKSDYLAQRLALAPGADLGYWALCKDSTQAPFGDYLIGLGLAIYRDIYLTPKMVNVIVSSGAAIAVYFLGRELFGRKAGLCTAALFAFLPWNVWLGMSGMASDPSSVLLISLFGLFLFRWLQSNEPTALLAAAVFLAVANGFRYENWIYTGVFSLLLVWSMASQWRAGRLQQRTTAAVISALVLINAFPVIYMAVSYYTLGDWLPEYKQAAFMISPGAAAPARTSSISIPVLALGSFPFELVASIAGLVTFLRLDRRRPFRIYLLLLGLTFFLFSTMVRWQLPSYGGIARYLLSFMTLLLPFGGFLLARLLKPPAAGWNARALLITAFVCVLGTFDLVRAFNYPGRDFPKDALNAGRALKGLQETGTVRDDARILIERTEDWGDEAVVVFANKPERFVVLNERGYLQAFRSGNLPNKAVPVALSGTEGVRGDVCYQTFQTEACRKSLREEGFDMVILATPERVRSFQEAFRTREWTIGNYHIFDLKRPVTAEKIPE
jgi:hypothetical protein